MDTGAVVFALLCSLALPVGASVWLAAHRRGRPLLIGALTFLVSQLLLRLPMLNYLLPRAGWYNLMQALHPGLYCLLLGVSAALFEELGRYAAIKLLLKGRRSPADAIAFGVGHGGLEAVALVGVNAAFCLIGGITSAAFFAAGAERLSAMVLHIAWSVMVMRSVDEKKPALLAAALVTHAAVDTLTGLAALMCASTAAIELCLGAVGAAAAVWTVCETKRRKAK